MRGYTEEQIIAILGELLFIEKILVNTDVLASIRHIKEILRRYEPLEVKT